MRLASIVRRRWSPHGAAVLALLAVTAIAVAAALAADGGGTPASPGSPVAEAPPQPLAVGAGPPTTTTTVSGDLGAVVTLHGHLRAAKPRVKLLALVRRRSRPPLVRLRATRRGPLVVRWSSGGRHGHTTLHVRPDAPRRVAVHNVPPRWPHAVRIRARLRPHGHGRARAQHIYPPPP